jgi:SAM-dependent methyltransferase
MTEPSRPICEYEDYDYRGRFWTPERGYEDAVERIALRRLLPRAGGRLVEIGAAFGRLADLYSGYEEVVLVDPAKSQLREAQKRLGDDQRYKYVVGDIYHLPLCDRAVDLVLTVRVLHHLTDVPAAFREVSRILRPQGRYVLEYANKRNLKEILRFLGGRSEREPFSQQPVEYTPLHFVFHPSYVERALAQAGLEPERSLAVSSLRLAFFKRLVPLAWMIRMDQLLQSPTALLKVAPSMFLLTRARKDGPSSDRLFRCPVCGSEELHERESLVLCGGCGREFPIEEGIYDFGSQGGEGVQL